MSYLNQAQDPRRRATAIVTVGAVHAVLAVGLLTGLTVQFTQHDDTRFEAKNFPLDTPKPDPSPTPEPQPAPLTYVAPPPLPPINLPTDTAPVPEPLDTNPTQLAYVATGKVDPPAPLQPPVPSITPKRALPSNNASRWISNNDYPRRALIDEAEGSVAYRLVIGTNGRVASCELTRSAGHRALDDATCRLISDRARFDPATDETGAKVLGTYNGSVRWQIPE